MPARLSIVDLSDFDARKQEVSRQLLEAATGSGFFYVTGHGISQVLRTFRTPASACMHSMVRLPTLSDPSHLA